MDEVKKIVTDIRNKNLAPIYLLMGEEAYYIDKISDFIQDNVLWTEEGHRLSWRMMLRSKSSITTFTVVNKNTKAKTKVNLNDYLTKKQIRLVSAKPDGIWQFAQYLKKEYNKKGEDIHVFVNARVSINKRPYKQFIDQKVDMANVEWKYFTHNEWILPSK